MQRVLPSLSYLAAFVFLAFSAQAADTVAFVAKTSNASTISFFNPSTGKQTGGEGLGAEAASGAVYSTNGAIAYVVTLPEKGEALTGYDVTTGKPIGSIPLGLKVVTTPLSNNVFALYNYQSHSELYQLDPSTFSLTEVFSGPPNADAMAVSPDGAAIYLATPDSLLFISSSTFKVTKSLTIANISQIVPSPDGRRLYLGIITSSAIAALDLSSDTIAGSFPAHLYRRAVTVSPDSSAIYVINNYLGAQLTLEQVSASTLTVQNSVLVPESLLSDSPVSLAISPDGSTLAMPSSNSIFSITLFSLPSLSVISVTPSGDACGLAFRTATQIAATNCKADTVDVIDVTTQKVSRQIDAGPSPAIALSAAQGELLFVYNQSGVWAIQTKTGTILNRIQLAPTTLPATLGEASLALSEARGILFAATADGVAEISTTTTKLLGYVSGIPSGSSVSAIATSSQAPYLFVGLNNDFILVINQATGALIGTYPTPSIDPLFLVSSPDGTAVYFTGLYPSEFDAPIVTVFNVLSGTFSAAPGLLYSGGGIALSPNGQTLYVPYDGSIQAYNVATQTVTTLPSPVDPFNIAITPDGTTLAVTVQSSSNDVGIINIANPIIGGLIPVGGHTSGISIP